MNGVGAPPRGRPAGSPRRFRCSVPGCRTAPRKAASGPNTAAWLTGRASTIASQIRSVLPGVYEPEEREGDQHHHERPSHDDGPSADAVGERPEGRHRHQLQRGCDHNPDQGRASRQSELGGGVAQHEGCEEVVEHVVREARSGGQEHGLRVGAETPPGWASEPRCWVSLTRANAGVSMTLSLMKSPTPTSTMESRNGIRQPHARSCSSGNAETAEKAPVESNSPAGIPSWGQLP